MPTFTVKSRKTMPVEITEVEAETRQHAIAATVETAGEGESIEVMDAKEGSVNDTGGVTGPTGTAR